MSDWPVELRGVTETVVTTRGPNDRWNLAALGVQAPAGAERASGEHSEPRAAPVEHNSATATTWGNTRTRRNFHREGEGYVQFVSDPVVFADAALSIREADEPVLDAADAWARVDVEQTGADTVGGSDAVDDEDDGSTRREHWALEPVEAGVERERPFTINRGFAAVVEATVAASRLDVPGYDTETLRERLRYFGDVAQTCGGEREREAIEQVREHADGEW
ncbi:DUF447 domain-containing protein [Halobacterium zhouii]|uniref:DUF447 domain-containing protein n=1 Tax=Halobacterium zhouii TaxID=2902624 RepID=UPI001E30CA62|nr:DUF447 domain-containing protein [Halobacterium zhouii]